MDFSLFQQLWLQQFLLCFVGFCPCLITIYWSLQFDQKYFAICLLLELYSFCNFNAKNMKNSALQLKTKQGGNRCKWDLFPVEDSYLMELYAKGFTQIHTDKRAMPYWKMLLWPLEIREKSHFAYRLPFHSYFYNYCFQTFFPTLN